MVVSSLKTYIKKVCALSVSEFKIDDLFLISNDIIYSDDEKKDILNCIHKMKILDPACGSGAFPMGVLQRVFMIINRLDPENKYYRDSILNATANIYAKKEFNKIFEAKKFSYAYKLSILESMIYSVDIEPIAIEIARLRAFLSLGVEEEKDLNDSDNFGIKPLPNLEFQFIIANSLVGLSKDGGFGDFWASIFNAMIERIEKISEKYFEANTDEAKNFVKLNFEAFREEVKLTDIDDDLKNRLLSWNPFDNTSCDFFEPHIQFGIKGNFNIVLGNPPYVQLQSMKQKNKETLKNENYKMFASTGDIYQLFFEKCFNLLSSHGVVSLITSNKWLRAGYGEKTREYFSSCACVHRLVDLGGGRFESATVDTSIILYGKNTSHKQDYIKALTYKDSLDCLANLDESSFNSKIYPSKDAWIILSDIEASILKKMNTVGTPLKDWDISINRGVLTGFNEAFIIDGATKEALIKEDKKSAEIIKPILRGRDIKRYSYEFADMWLIFIPWHFSLHKDDSIQGSSEKAEKAFQKEYSAIYNHLLKYKKQLSNRNKAETGIRYEWYALQRCAATYYEDFEKPKIVWQRITDKNKFILSPKGNTY